MTKHTETFHGMNFRRTLLASAVGCALALALQPCALATTYPVTSNGDSGPGTLRQAVIDANADTSPPTVVSIPSGLGTITLTSGSIAISNAMTIQGPGSASQTISGNNASRIFYIKPPFTATSAIDVTVSGVTLSGGNAGNANGGAIEARGVNLVLSHSVLTGNITGAATSGNFRGGAVYVGNYNGGSLDIEYSTLTNNSAPYFGGAVNTLNLVSATINQSTLDDNTAGGSGGAAFLAANAIALTHSTISGNQSGSRGGGAALKAAAVAGTFDVSNCMFADNKAVSGGAMYLFHGAPTIGATTISGNTVSGSGGGIYAYQTNLTITGSTITGNTAAGTGTNTGGGINAQNAALTINQSLISGNTAKSGGGLTVNNPVYGGTSGLIIQYSTISANSTTYGQGGGLFVPADVNFAATLTNDTIVGNSASNARPYGGGVYSNVGHGGTGVLTIQSSTIANNSAKAGGGVDSNPYTHAIIHNSIVANNTASTADPDLAGSFTANFDFIRNTSGATFIAGSGNNLTGADPQLGSLGYYGGPTPTKLPLATSPVINAGDFAPTTLTYDQRGNPYARVVNSRIDIGADERQTSEDTIFLDGFEGY